MGQLAMARGGERVSYFWRIRPKGFDANELEASERARGLLDLLPEGQRHLCLIGPK